MIAIFLLQLLAPMLYYILKHNPLLNKSKINLIKKKLMEKELKQYLKDLAAFLINKEDYIYLIYLHR